MGTGTKDIANAFLRFSYLFKYCDQNEWLNINIVINLCIILLLLKLHW